MAGGRKEAEFSRLPVELPLRSPDRPLLLSCQDDENKLRRERICALCGAARSRDRDLGLRASTEVAIAH